MKFMVTGTQVTPATDFHTQISYLEESKTWVHNGLQNKMLDAAYSFPSGGGLFILEADSNEDLMAILMSFPLRHLSHFDIHPLADFEDATNMVIASLLDYV